MTWPAMPETPDQVTNLSIYIPVYIHTHVCCSVHVYDIGGNSIYIPMYIHMHVCCSVSIIHVYGNSIYIPMYIHMHVCCSVSIIHVYGNSIYIPMYIHMHVCCSVSIIHSYDVSSNSGKYVELLGSSLACMSLVPGLPVYRRILIAHVLIAQLKCARKTGNQGICP